MEASGMMIASGVTSFNGGSLSWHNTVDHISIKFPQRPSWKRKNIQLMVAPVGVVYQAKNAKWNWFIKPIQFRTWGKELEVRIELLLSSDSNKYVVIDHVSYFAMVKPRTDKA